MACRSSNACSTISTSAWLTPAGACDHHRLVELLNRAIHVLQPTNDRGGHHRAHTLIDHAGLTADRADHPSQPGHRLLDKHIAGPTPQTGRTGAGHHLHRQNAVPAQIEERLINPDPLQPQHLRVNAGQNLLGLGFRAPGRVWRQTPAPAAPYGRPSPRRSTGTSRARRSAPAPCIQATVRPTPDAPR